MNFNDKEDLLGKILFVISVLLLVFAFVVAFVFPYLSIDEWFTLGLMKWPVIQQVKITAIDVHPPLYYMILKAGDMLFEALHLNINQITIMEIVSIVPYIFILGFAVTRIRKEYGWLSCGVFAFTLFAMSNFFTQYLNARMYSWGLLFTVFGFLCVKPILEENDIKYWILLAFFALCGAYTHYFVAITFVSIYILLFAYILIKHRDYIKNWFISTVIGIVLYAPWIYILIRQMHKVKSNYWVETPTVESVMECIGCLLTSYNEFILSAAVLLLFVVFLAVVVWKLYKDREEDDVFMLIGLLAIVLSVLIALVLSFKFKPILVVRYIVPLFGIVWVVFSVFIDKISVRKIVIPLVLIVMIVGFVNIAVQMDAVAKEHAATDDAMDYLSGINDNKTLVVYEGMQKYLRFSGFLNDTGKQFVCYELNGTDHNPSYVPILKLNNDSFSFSKDVKNYSDYDIIYIRDITNKMKSNKDYKADKDYRVGNCVFTKLTPK